MRGCQVAKVCSVEVFEQLQPRHSAPEICKGTFDPQRSCTPAQLRKRDKHRRLLCENNFLWHGTQNEKFFRQFSWVLHITSENSPSKEGRMEKAENKTRWKNSKRRHYRISVAFCCHLSALLVSIWLKAWTHNLLLFKHSADARIHLLPPPSLPPACFNGHLAFWDGHTLGPMLLSHLSRRTSSDFKIVIVLVASLPLLCFLSRQTSGSRPWSRKRIHSHRNMWRKCNFPWRNIFAWRSDVLSLFWSKASRLTQSEFIFQREKVDLQSLHRCLRSIQSRNATNTNPPPLHHPRP